MVNKAGPTGVRREQVGSGGVSSESRKSKYPPWLRALLLAAVSAVVVVTSCARNDARVVEERLCVLHDSIVGWEYAESTRQIAYVARAGREYVVVADGAESGPYDSVMSLQFSPRGTRLAYVARARGRAFSVLDGSAGPEFDWVGRPVFSPDEGHIAYEARRNGKAVVVVDGQPGNAYDGIWGLAFIRDGAHVAYVARIESTEFVVEDSTRTEACGFASSRRDNGSAGFVAYATNTRTGNQEAAIIHAPGRRVDVKGHVMDVYASRSGSAWAADVSQNRRQFVVGDWGRSPTCDYVRGPVFGPDGNRVAFVLSWGELAGPDPWNMWPDTSIRSRVFVDGRLDPPCFNIQTEELVFSPDGEHLAYKAQGWHMDTTIYRDEYEWHVASRTELVVVDGKADPEYPRVSKGPQFSPDSRHVVYVARGRYGEFVVTDGRPGPSYDMVDTSGPVFPVAGGRVMYCARRGAKWFLDIDSRFLRLYDSIWGLVFSRDGRRWGCCARTGDTAFVIIDRNKEPGHYGVYQPVFSPNGGSWAYVAEDVAGQDTSVRLVTPGLPSEDCDAILAFAVGDSHTEYVARRGTHVYVAFDGRAGPRCDSLVDCSFNEDTTALAAIVRIGRHEHVTSQGWLGPAYDSILTIHDWFRDCGPAFTPDGNLEYFGVRGKSLYRVRHLGPSRR